MARHPPQHSTGVVDHQPSEVQQTDKWSAIMGKVLQSNSSKTQSNVNRSKLIVKKAKKPKIRPVKDSPSRISTAKSDALMTTMVMKPSALIAASEEAEIDNSAAKIEKERNLRKVATRGVVQLFNMLKKQQNPPTPTVETVRVVKPVAREVDSGVKAVTPRSFLELLAQSSRMQRQAGENRVPSAVASESGSQLNVSAHADNSPITKVDLAQPTVLSPNKKDAEKPKWNVLRNDYMLDAHLKNWDQAIDSENDAET